MLEEKVGHQAHIRGVIGIKCAGQNMFNTVQDREIL